jgi:hypothetical protein
MMNALRCRGTMAAHGHDYRSCKVMLMRLVRTANSRSFKAPGFVSNCKVNFSALHKARVAVRMQQVVP